MKILLASTAVYVSNLTGANKINRALVEQLVRRGHECHVIALQKALFNISSVQEPAEATQAFAGRETAIQDLNGVEVHSLDAAHPGHLPRLREYLQAHIKDFDPTWILISSEDWGQFLLQAAVETAAERVVYLAHTPLALPFGPDAIMPNPAATEMLRQIAGIISLSQFLTDFIREWSGMEALTVYPHAYGDGPFPRHGRHDRGYVTMINPCVVKGSPIFIALARALPEVEFAAVLSWGTTERDQQALAELPNVTTIAPTADIDQFFAQTRILLAPSLWHESFGLVVVEAMLRGIPVLASDVGGLPEAKLGTRFLLPVTPITSYAMTADRSLAGDLPPQDIGPWRSALEQLLGDRALYEAEAEASRTAALGFLATIGVERYEEALARLGERQAQLRQRIEQLSPKKRALLESLRKSRPTKDPRA